MTSELPPIPEGLLAPLLDEAAAALRGLDPTEVPSSLRSLAGFDARGLARGAARRQLQRALEEHEAFRASVFDRFLARADVAEALATWSARNALQIVDDASPASLPLIASMLYAARPDGWGFGLGAACAAATREARTDALDDEVRARAAELSAAAEARRRAETARADAERQRARLEGELRTERQSRRDREVRAEREIDDMRRRASASEDALGAARAAADAAESRLRRQAERAARLERELAEAKRAASVTPVDRAALREAATDARMLAARLDELAARTASASAGAGRDPEPPPPVVPRSRPRRVQPACPPGLLSDTPAGLDAMLRSRGVVLVVDGYNVSKTAWATAPLEEQRERLVAALAELHLRIRCEVVVVFDGADVRGVPLPRRPGVRVMFSAPGESADDVVVREAAAPPGTVPVVVASSDAEVRERAQADGAAVVAAPVLLAVLRR